MLENQPLLMTLVSVLGNAIVILFVYFNKRRDKVDDDIFTKIESKADKKETSIIFNFIKEIRDKIENNFVKAIDCKDFKTRIGDESNRHRKSIEALKIGVARLLERSGIDPAIMGND